MLRQGQGNLCLSKFLYSCNQARNLQSRLLLLCVRGVCVCVRTTAGGCGSWGWCGGGFVLMSQGMSNRRPRFMSLLGQESVEVQIQILAFSVILCCHSLHRAVLAALLCMTRCFCCPSRRDSSRCTWSFIRSCSVDLPNIRTQPHLDIAWHADATQLVRVFRRC